MFELLSGFILFSPIIVFLLSPIIAFIVGCVKISRYNDARYYRAMHPDSYTEEDMKDLRKPIIAAFASTFVLAIVVISVVVLFSDEIAYM